LREKRSCSLIIRYSSVEPGYGEVARPDLPALLLLADADETADGIDGRLGSPPQHGSAKL
jgi:hypothetical protein